MSRSEIENPLKESESAYLVRDHLEEIYRCPWCFYPEFLRKYLVKSANGYSRKRALCPGCNQLMSVNLLTREQTVFVYVRWLQLTHEFDYTSKIKFDKIMENMTTAKTPWWIINKVKNIKYSSKRYIPR